MQNLTFNNTLPIQTDRVKIYTHVQFGVAQGNLAVLINVGVQSYNVHIVGHFTFFETLIVLVILVLTRYKASRIFIRVFLT